MTPRRWLVVSGFAVLAAAFIGPHVVPLYDGVGFPDQPYQYIGRAGHTTQTPSPVEQTIPRSDLAQYDTTLQSLESGPQVRVGFGPGSITLPGSATEIKLSATPEAPTDQPPSGTIASNVYLIYGTSVPGPPAVRSETANVFLRLPQGVSSKTKPTMIYRTPGGKWKQLETEQTGQDIYGAPFSGWGEYALAINMTAEPSPSATSMPNSQSHWLLVAAVVVGVIAVFIALIRQRSLEHGRSKEK